MQDTYLLHCKNYQNYLDKYVTHADTSYLRNIPVARMLAQLNYRPNVTVYTKEEFLRRKKQVYQHFVPENRRSLLFSWNKTPDDPFLHELALREKPNKQKVLSTIIHLRCVNKAGFEISGFIDYADSLHEANLQLKDFRNWAAIFDQRDFLRPKHSDLSFFDWHLSRIFFNDTVNYAIEHDVHGLIFMHRGDHKKLHVEKKDKIKENGYSRQIIHSTFYGYVILYDHIIRKKI